jgi:hypothetical protein
VANTYTIALKMQRHHQFAGHHQTRKSVSSCFGLGVVQRVFGRQERVQTKDADVRNKCECSKHGKGTGTQQAGSEIKNPTKQKCCIETRRASSASAAQREPIKRGGERKSLETQITQVYTQDPPRKRPPLHKATI